MVFFPSSPSFTPSQRSWTFIVLVIAILTPLYFFRASFIGQNTVTQESKMAGLNVFKKPLALFSKSPMTGFYRDGYCRSGAADFGNHAVAGIVSEEFLDFTASQGNDLRIAGLSGGCKWCLCTARWLEAFQAHNDGRISQQAVPKVQLNATHESALSKVDLDTFKQFAAEEGSTP